MREGLGEKPGSPLRALLGMPADTDDLRVARAIVGELTRADGERLARVERRNQSALGGSSSLMPRPA